MYAPTMNDKDLDRMITNLQKAFNEAAETYEKAEKGGFVRDKAVEFAAVSQAYLLATREKDERGRRERSL